VKAGHCPILRESAKNGGDPDATFKDILQMLKKIKDRIEFIPKDTTDKKIKQAPLFE
jgi:hypothetical protein